jgi:hypothetical protein
MKKRKTIILAIASILFAVASCTDATRASWGSLGNSANVKCYSGGVVIYDGVSTGKVATTEQSDGWEFRESKTNKFVRVSGDCVIEN